jgi:hypothetical protein
MGAAVAEDLEYRGYKAAGVVRQLAAIVAQVPEPDPDACPRCGAEIVQPPTGRRRRWCSTRCQSAARRADRRETVA